MSTKTKTMEAARSLAKALHHPPMNPAIREAWIFARALLAAEADNARLREALAEAREMVDAWAAYASDYFREKHDLAAEADNARLREALAEAREMVDAWAAYASDYFREKHDLAAEAAKIDAITVRATALEEAAKVADGYKISPDPACRTVAKWIAEDIRALKDTP